MKKIILPFIMIILFSGNSHSQFMELVYQNSWVIPNIESMKFQTFYFTPGQPKQMFYQSGVGGYGGAPCMNQPTHHNTFRFNQYNYTSVLPFNGFLDRRGCENFLGSCFWIEVQDYSISHIDQDFLIAHHLYSGHLLCNDSLYETYITYNGGLTKSSIYPGVKFFGMDIDPVNDSNVYLASANTVYKSINRGQSFQVMSNDHSVAGFIKVSPQNNSIIFLRVNGGMKISTNSGAGFSNLAVPEFTDMAIGQGSEIYASSLSGVFKSTDQGINWSQISGLQNVNTIELNPDNDNIIYIGTNHGVHRSVTGGLTFNGSALYFGEDARVFNISKDPNSLDTLYVITNAGIYKVWNLLVGNESISTEIPSEYSLFQNYPNPFNPSTKIKFSLPNNDFVKLVVYNSLGKEVATLVNEKLSVGTYEFTFDGTSFDSGIYFYNLNSSVGNQSRKMILIK